MDHNGPRGSPPPTMLQQQQHQQQQQQQQDGGSRQSGSGSNTGPQIFLSDLPEPPIPVSEIGPIPPPAMFSTPSPTTTSTARTHAGVIQQLQKQQQQQHSLPPPYGAHLSNGIVGIHNPQMDEYDYDGKCWGERERKTVRLTLLGNIN